MAEYGTTDRLTGGTPSASTEYGVGSKADKACDDNPTTDWRTAPATYPPHWWKYVSRGLSDAMNGAVGGFTSLGADVADGTTSDEQINEIMLTQAQIGFVAGEEIALYLRRENSGDADEVYIKSLKIQYIEV